MTVNRYSVDSYDFYDVVCSDVVKRDDGDYVLFEDYAATQARAEMLEAALRKIANERGLIPDASTMAIEAGKAKGVQFTAEECGYVVSTLAECARLKDAVKWERECRGVWSWLNNTLGNVRADLEIQRSTLAASTAVEELL